MQTTVAAVLMLTAATQIFRYALRRRWRPALNMARVRPQVSARLVRAALERTSAVLPPVVEG